MIDIRYHLAALIGVFLALGLGMLIGTQLAEDGRISEEQVRLVQRIEVSLERIRAENRRLTDELANLEASLSAEQEFVDMTLSALVAGALVERQIAMYVADIDAPAAHRVRSVLENAGATVALHRSPEPPAADDLLIPYVLLWMEEWGEPEVGADRWPAGGVIARPTRWVKTQSDALVGAAVGAVEHVGSPLGLLTLVQQLRDGPNAAADMRQWLTEKFAQ